MDLVTFIELRLLLKYIRAGAPEEISDTPFEDSENGSANRMHFAY